MKKLSFVMCALFSAVFMVGCETTQSQYDEITETEVSADYEDYVQVSSLEPEISYCTKAPLMADLTKSYQNRIYIEDGKPCTKKRRTY